MKTYSTWDSANKGGTVTLSGGDLIATQTNGGEGWGSVRSTIGVSTGKWYWEYTLTQRNDSRGGQHGVANASLSNFDDYPGHTANGWVKIDFGFIAGGARMNNDTPDSFDSQQVTGDILGFYLDADAGTIGYTWNGADQGTMFSGLTSSPFYAITGSGSIGTMILTANFGASALTYSPPVGYNAGLYSGSDDVGWVMAMI